MKFTLPPCRYETGVSGDIKNFGTYTRSTVLELLNKARNDALDQAACLFQQARVEYFFGDEVCWEILKLKEELK